MNKKKVDNFKELEIGERLMLMMMTPEYFNMTFVAIFTALTTLMTKYNVQIFAANQESTKRNSCVIIMCPVLCCGVVAFMNTLCTREIWDFFIMIYVDFLLSYISDDNSFIAAGVSFVICNFVLGLQRGMWMFLNKVSSCFPTVFNYCVPKTNLSSRCHHIIVICFTFLIQK